MSILFYLRIFSLALSQTFDRSVIAFLFNGVGSVGLGLCDWRLIIIPVSLPLSRSPSLFFGSLALSSPAGLAGTPSSPSPSPHLSHTLQSGTTEDRPFLPPEVLQQIVQETLRLDMAMLGVFNRVSNTFRELIKPLHPSIYKWQFGRGH